MVANSLESDCLVTSKEMPVSAVTCWETWSLPHTSMGAQLMLWNRENVTGAVFLRQVRSGESQSGSAMAVTDISIVTASRIANSFFIDFPPFFDLRTKHINRIRGLLHR